MFGLGKIVSEMKKLGVIISPGAVKFILRQHQILPPDDRRYTVTVEE